MNIKSIASSSKGCAYLIESNGYQLLIECGIPLKRIRQALNHDLSKVVGCLVSHSHGDHAQYLPKLETETSIPIYCTDGTRKRFCLQTCETINHMERFKTGGKFVVYPIELKHDVQCFGFLIVGGYGEKLFYATDTSQVNFTFKGLSHLMIEANHSFESMIESERNSAALSRACQFHLDIDQVLEFVSRHTELEEIHLIHLSAEHADARQYKERVARVAGVPVYVAGE
jgi:phosphoribosyl 1,2-cyclic phosphodiesterase